MFFSTSLAIPANTPRESPVRATLDVVSGTVRHVWVRWRWGSGNLCGARARYQEFQHWPLSPTGWFPSTPDPLEFAESLPVSEPPLEIVLEGYNDDEVYPHTVWFAVEVDRGEVSANLRQFIAFLEGAR